MSSVGKRLGGGWINDKCTSLDCGWFHLSLLVWTDDGTNECKCCMIPIKIKIRFLDSIRSSGFILHFIPLKNCIRKSDKTKNTSYYFTQHLSIVSCNNRVIPEIGHSGSSAKIGLVQNKFSKKLPLTWIEPVTLGLYGMLTSCVDRPMSSQLTFGL